MVREEEIVPEDDDVQEAEQVVSRNSQISASARTSTDKPQDNAPRARMHRPTWFDPWGLVSVILPLLIALLVLKIATPPTLKPKLWTPEELAKYNGTDKRLPLLLGILGVIILRSVFDVSRGRNHYGPGGGYHHFTGRDASRAFVSGNFTAQQDLSVKLGLADDGLTNSLQGLTALQIKSVDDWKTFFKKKYKYMGTVVGRFYDDNGNPTKELTRVAQQVILAEKIKQQQREDEKQFPPCNSQWNAAEGGQVWCEAGYPRIVERISEGVYKGATGFRCACFEKKFLGRKGLKTYDGCPSTAQKCQSAPPRAKQS